MLWSLEQKKRSWNNNLLNRARRESRGGGPCLDLAGTMSHFAHAYTGFCFAKASYSLFTKACKHHTIAPVVFLSCLSLRLREVK